MNKLLFLFCFLFLINNNIYGKNYAPVTTFGFLIDADIFLEFKSSKKALRHWIREFGKRRDIPLDAVFYEDVSKLYKDYNKNKFGASTLYVDFFFDNYDEIMNTSDDFWSISFSKRNSSKYCLITNKDSTIKDITGIKGKTLSVTKHNISSIWLNKRSLEVYKESSEKVLKKLLYEKKGSTILLNVYFKKIDLGIISDFTWNTMLELNPTIQKNIKVIECIDFPVSSYIGMFKKNIAKKEYKNIFFDFTQKLVYEKDSDEFFSLMNFEHVYKIKKDDIEKMKQFFQEYKYLQKIYK